MMKEFVVPLPDRMKRLPVNKRGYPVPFFVSWSKDGKECAIGEGEPNFVAVSTRRMAQCVKLDLCWICGERLGRFKAFVAGPMCCVTRTSSEPPSHLDCAEFAARACPFLVNPREKRDTKNLPSDAVDPAGIMLERNPGVAAVWLTKEYSPFAASNGVLFKMGDPITVSWWREARAATRAEVLESIAGGLPTLQAIAEAESPDAVRELQRVYQRFEPLLPA